MGPETGTRAEPQAQARTETPEPVERLMGVPGGPAIVAALVSLGLTPFEVDGLVEQEWFDDIAGKKRWRATALLTCGVEAETVVAHVEGWSTCTDYVQLWFPASGEAPSTIPGAVLDQLVSAWGDVRGWAAERWEP